MDKSIISPANFGSALHRTKSRLTENNQVAYANYVVAKNDNQVSYPELSKMHSRIFRGFFCACDKVVYCAIMTGCVGERLVSALRSPRSLDSGSTNPARSVTLRFVPKVTVSNSSKEAVKCL